MSKTARTIENRLFPPKTWDHGWSLSLQADIGYQCEPAERLEFLEDYDAVEVSITGPFPGPVDIETMDLPQNVLDKFPMQDSGIRSSIGLKLTWQDVEALENAILLASMRPNTGIPQGIHGWRERTVYHGTSLESAKAIDIAGIDLGKSHLGYFGRAFYVADDKDLAISNYAQMVDEDETPAVVELVINDQARIIDMRNAKDAEIWSKGGFDQFLGNDALPTKAILAGIDGIYDRSVGGLAIYNPQVLTLIRIHEPSDPHPTRTL